MKLLSYNEYKKVTRLEHNQFNHWLEGVINEVNQAAIDTVMTEVVGDTSDHVDICRVTDDEMREILKSVGIQPHCIDVIMSKL